MTSREPRPEEQFDEPQQASSLAVTSQSRRLITIIVALTVVVAAVDQLTKVLALNKLEEGAPTIWFLGELLGWKLLFNPGAALSLGTGMTWVLTLVAVAVVVVVVRISRRIGSIGWSMAFGLLLGGAIGNLIDRFFRAPGFASGHVVDFINYNGFFVGNVADIAIVLAAAMIMLLSLRGVTIAQQPPAMQAVPGEDGLQMDELDPDAGTS